jgi:hypothetical protein
MRRLLPLAAFVLTTAAAFACGLDDGGISMLTDGDAAVVADTSTDGNLGSDGNITDANGGSETSTITDAADAGTDSGTGRFVFATTSTTLYALNVSTYALVPVDTFAGCGIPNGYDTVDPSQDSLGRVFLLTHVNANGQFSYYAIHLDGGCTDVHGGPGAGPNGPGFWAGYQKVGTTDTLLALEMNQTPVIAYNGLAQYQGQANNVIPGAGATSDIACTSALCYTALAANRCPSTSATDCLFAFESDGGGTATQVGSFGKSGIVGIAYDEGSVFGFASDGSIIKISTTAPSVGAPITTTVTSTTGLVWQGAASSSANL